MLGVKGRATLRSETSHNEISHIETSQTVKQLSGTTQLKVQSHEKHILLAYFYTQVIFALIINQLSA